MLYKVEKPYLFIIQCISLYKGRVMTDVHTHTPAQCVIRHWEYHCNSRPYDTPHGCIVIQGGKGITFSSSSVSHRTKAEWWQMYIHIHLH